MKRIMYAILSVPVIAALIVGIVFLPTSVGSIAAAPLKSIETSDQALEQEEEELGDRDDTDDAVDKEDESISPDLANQVRVSADEAGEIASNYLSVQSSAVQSIELEKEAGSLHYSVAVTKENHTFDIEVDAITGEIGSVEQED